MTTNTSQPSDSDFFQCHPLHSSLQEIQRECWKELCRAAGNPLHPWARVSLATLGESGPEQRILILRQAADENRLVFYTDVRTPKIDQIKRNPHVSGLCYSAEHRVQLSFQAVAHRVSDPETVQAHWNATPVDSRRNYMGIQAPGSASPFPSVNLPAGLPTTQLTPEQTEPGQKHFAVLELELTSLELLWLRPEGNYRAILQLGRDTSQSRWVQP